MNRDKQKKAQDLLLQNWAVVEQDLKQKRLDQQQSNNLALVPAADTEDFNNAEIITDNNNSMLSLDVTTPDMESSFSLPSTITNPSQPPQRSPPSHHHAAALLIQSVYRGYSVRRVLSLYYAQRTIRIFDPNAGRSPHPTPSPHPLPLSIYTPPKENGCLFD